MEKYNDLINYLNSQEGEKSIRKYFEKISKREEHTNRWIEKLKDKYQHNIDHIIEKLMGKYYSDEYIDREYKIGVQPRETLFWLVWEYSKKYSKECNDIKYFNQFTVSGYYIGSYVIQMMSGQGSTIRIDKIT